MVKKTTKNPGLAATFAVGLALVLSMGWLKIAEQRPLWGDEIYSEIGSVKAYTYAQILMGKLDEGNKAPLFYVIQKAWGDVFKYEAPKAWSEGDWKYSDPYSNVFLRFWPVVCTAAGVAAIFYYFAAGWGMWTGWYSLMVSLSSFMVWQYVVEARPYALWFMLSALQMIFVLKWSELKDKTKGGYAGHLAIVNCLLSLTVIFSIVQTAVTCVILLCAGVRRWKSYIPLLAVPAAITAYYVKASGSMPFWFNESFMGILGASLPQDRLAIIGMGALVMGIAAIKWWKPEYLQRFWLPFLFTAFILAGCIAVLIKFKMEAVQPGGSGYPVSNRYFMLLVPPGIIMTTIASYYLVALSKGWVKTGVQWMLGALLIFRVYKTYKLVIMGLLSLFMHKG